MRDRAAKRHAAEDSVVAVATSSPPPAFDSPPADGSNTGLGPPRKRKRRVVSCAECHRRKQKCDRNQPCRACVDRKMEASCHYETTAMSHERHHMRVTEAAAYGRSLQEDGSLPVKATGFGYASGAENTLGFLRKIDRERRRSSDELDNIGMGALGMHGMHRVGSMDMDGIHGINGLNGIGAMGMGSLSSLVQDTGNGIVTTTAAEAAALAEQQYLQSQQPHGATANGLGSPVTGDPYGVTDRYKTLVRELPPRPFIERLVAVFFRHFNWHYYALDEDVFLKRLADWNDVAMGPFGSLQAPHQLSPDLRAFPALLFQVLAMGLLVLPAEEPATEFDAIRHPSNATLEGLAMDYSEAGIAILALLGKRHMALTTVVAGFLRAGFLKYVALITEAWHAVGSAIRDAQEIGLHRSSLDPKPWAQTAEAVLANEWEIQSRRRMWMTLVSWDTHMAVVLGRPMAVEASENPVLPVDCILPRTMAERATMPVTPRGEDDPPTPLTRAVWSFQAILPLRAIYALEKQGPALRDFSAVDALHDELVHIEATVPPFLRLENPDTRFDSLPECHWLPAVRVTVPQLTIFNFMALHRQYILTRARSRTEALRACLSMLQMQRLHFSQLRPQQYRMFSLFFGTFDALVLVASIYILFPKEHPTLVPAAIQHFRWSVERLERMSEQSSLARSGLGVLQAIYLRLRKALGIPFLEGGGGDDDDEMMIPAVPAATVSSASADLLHNIDPSLHDAAPTHEPTPSTHDRGSSTSSSVSPNAAGGFSATSTSASGPSSAASAVSAASDVFSTAMAAAASLSTAPLALDPALAAEYDSGTLGRFGEAQEAADLAAIFPDSLDWTSFQPICPTGDLTYNILMGVSDGSPGMGTSGWTAGDGLLSTEPLTASAVTGRPEAVVSAVAVPKATKALPEVSIPGGVSATESRNLDKANGAHAGVSGNANSSETEAPPDAALEMDTAAAAAAATSIDGTAVPWQFEGDFARNSIWGLLNIYGPF